MNSKHPSHVTRISMDASTYDEICINCGATDEVPGGWGALARPCTVAVAAALVRAGTDVEQRAALLDTVKTALTEIARVRSLEDEGGEE
jgi:hypothetical protein